MIIDTRPAEAPKRRRRGHGEGGVYKRQDGRWEATLELGGKGDRRQRKHFYGRTKAEALERLAAAKARLRTGLRLPDERLTVGCFFGV